MLVIDKVYFGASHEGVFSTGIFYLAAVGDHWRFVCSKLLPLGSTRSTPGSDPAQLPTPGKIPDRNNRPHDLNQVIQKFPDLLDTHAKSQGHAFYARCRTFD